MPSKNRYLPDWIDSFMRLTDDAESPVLYRKWTAISCVASALQRKCRVKLGVSLTFYPNMYIVLVGPSSTGKGTIMAYASELITQVPNIRLSAQTTSLQAIIRRMKEANFIDVDEETGKTMFHASMTIFSTEFAVFLGYHNNELISALCDWYDCHDVWTYDTISRDRETINGVWVNILAGTTQESLISALPREAIGVGLTSRIIFVNEYSRKKLVIFPEFTQEILTLQRHLIEDLSQIQLLSGEFKLSKDFLEFYADWVSQQEANPPFHDKKFDGYMGRRRRHIIALSMICCASRSDSMCIEGRDIIRAAELLTEVEVKMSTVFRGMGKSDIAVLLSDSIKYFETSPRKEIHISEFMRDFEGDMDKFTLNRVIETLKSSNYIRIERRPGVGEFIIVL